jgi:hypothetical protein
VRAIGRVEVEALQHLCAAGLLQPAAHPGEHVDDLAAAEVRPGRDVARDVGEAAVQGRCLAPRVAAEHGRRAGVRPQQSEEHPDGGGLAGPVGAEEAVHLALLDGEA